MASYNNKEGASQAPSGSRLAQYLNGRTTGGFPETSRFSGSGGGIGNSGTGESYLYENNDKDVMSPNIPLVGLQIANEEILKQRWASTGHNSFFTDPDVRNDLMLRQLAMHCHQSSSSAEPAVVEHFRNLRQLARTPVMRYGPTTMEYTYKALNVENGIVFALHRITNSRQLSAYALSQLNNWQRICHSNIVKFHEVLHTNAWNDSSVLFVYEFQPQAETILKHFFHSNGTLKSKYTGPGISGLAEQHAWSFIIQMSSAIRTVHAAKMACRCVDVNRIMVNSSGRFSISGVGIPDAMNEPPQNVIPLQIEDLRMFGAVLCALLNGAIGAHSNMNIDQRYSPDLRNVIKLLCQAHASPNRVTSVNEIMPMIGARFYAQVDSLQIRVDMLENEMCKELQNGRLFRLLCMLCTITDRNLPREPFWSEQSEQFMLKQLHKYIFHQVDEFGRPILDLAHIVMSLNKLDSGADEVVQLADNDNVLIDSYKHLRSNLESSFAYLKREMDSSISPDVDPKMLHEADEFGDLPGAYQFSHGPPEQTNP